MLFDDVELPALINAPKSHDSLIEVHNGSSLGTGNVGKACVRESQHPQTMNPPNVEKNKTRAIAPTALIRKSMIFLKILSSL